MTSELTHEDAVEILQELGLKEYEAKCFVGLSRMPHGTAKSLSEVTDVPRTRVYDAVRVLEAKGLVEVQHSSPQRFKAVPLAEATETLRDQYETKIQRFQTALEDIQTVDGDDDADRPEIWSLTGTDAVENRVNRVIEDATDEVVLVIGSESVLTDALIESLTAVDDSVTLSVGTSSTDIRECIEREIPNATAILSDLNWLECETELDADAAVGRLLLVDRSEILVSSIDHDTGEERAIFGTGLTNGLIVIARRLLSQNAVETAPPDHD
ncbi:TrmB family transcriptional regulator [Haloarcula salina]|uniref:TrmB family transcriptional regulator n=1 Tax=Haloarcula salina TaxID=1429914 RepID=A0AA41FZ81_9EURY|nr:TrmB family transcriptional regulator [Haloarcula salina]MBV0900629.1 TrmB family transcriptional regulator [Haloarcula salina]